MLQRKVLSIRSCSEKFVCFIMFDWAIHNIDLNNSYFLWPRTRYLFVHAGRRIWKGCLSDFIIAKLCGPELHHAQRCKEFYIRQLMMENEDNTKHFKVLFFFSWAKYFYYFEVSYKIIRYLLKYFSMLTMEKYSSNAQQGLVQIS